MTNQMVFTIDDPYTTETDDGISLEVKVIGNYFSLSCQTGSETSFTSLPTLPTLPTCGFPPSAILG